MKNKFGIIFITLLVIIYLAAVSFKGLWSAADNPSLDSLGQLFGRDNFIELAAVLAIGLPIYFIGSFIIDKFYKKHSNSND